MTTLVRAERLWVCSKCRMTDITREARPHTRFHPCAGMGGLAMPMVPADTRVKVTVHEREDFIGNETVTTVAGRPIMSVTTERPDGSNDVVVYAPRASASIRGGDV
jgi:hypothetical protein